MSRWFYKGRSWGAQLESSSTLLQGCKCLHTTPYWCSYVQKMGPAGTGNSEKAEGKCERGFEVNTTHDHMRSLSKRNHEKVDCTWIVDNSNVFYLSCTKLDATNYN